jgi:hypothetical protein
MQSETFMPWLSDLVRVRLLQHGAAVFEPRLTPAVALAVTF